MAIYDKELIIRYVDDELSAPERQQFEADLQKDPVLGAEVSLYRELKATLQQRLPPDDKRDQLRSTLSVLNKSYFSAASGAGARRVPLTRWLAGMAAAAAVVTAVLLLWPSEKDNVIGRLGRTEMIGTSERGSNADSLLQQAAVFFNSGQFAKALPLLDRAVRADSSSQLALFYRGVAAWHTGAVDAARRDLQKVSDGESLLRYEAAFYMALTYAAQKNTSAARDWLKRIPEDAPISAKAKELSASLK
jgi:tetratricopeptide (TPR) repeat protein